MATPPEYVAASAAFCSRTFSSTSPPALITIPSRNVNAKIVTTDMTLIVPRSSRGKAQRCRRARTVSETVGKGVMTSAPEGRNNLASGVSHWEVEERAPSP